MPSDPIEHPSAVPHHPATGGPLHNANATPPKAGPISKFARAAGVAPGSPGGPSSPVSPIGMPSGAGLGAAGSPGQPGSPGPKDTIPIAKTPRKQRSSRFHVTEKVEIHRLPSFLGSFALSSWPSRLAETDLSFRGPFQRSTRPVPAKTAAKRGRL